MDLAARLEELLAGEWRCDCGRSHPAALPQIHVGPSAWDELGRFVRERGVRDAVLAADDRTYEAAGKEAERLLRGCGVQVHPLVFGAPLAPDERAVEALRRAPAAGLYVAAGAGVVHDLVRFVATERKTPFVSLPTAPSVDGFTSSVSALIQGGVKRTLPAGRPAALFADPAVLAGAPPELIAAGFGDVIGKATALADWSLAREVTGEPLCSGIWNLTAGVVRAVAPLAEGIRCGEPAAVESLFMGLLLTGIAIHLAGSSRPASGAEHHLSHYWEMRLLWSGRPEVLHGAKVGVATPIVARLYEALFEEPSPGPAAPSPAGWEEVSGRIRRHFGPLAGEILAQNEARYRDPREAWRRRRRIAARWGEIRSRARPLIWPADQIVRLLREAGAPATPEELGIEPGWVRAGIVAAKEVRPRYTVLQLADDLGLLERLAQRWDAE